MICPNSVVFMIKKQINDSSEIYLPFFYRLRYLKKSLLPKLVLHQVRQQT